MKHLKAWALVFVIVAIFLMPVFVSGAEELQGTISVVRNNARQITGANLLVGSQEYSIVMDENGRSIAQTYEHKEIKVECDLNGNQLKAITWKHIKPPPSPEPVYEEPEPEPEDEENEDGDEDKEESENDEDSDEDSDENEDEDANEDEDEENSKRR
jgi:hypothetical protein